MIFPIYTNLRKHPLEEDKIIILTESGKFIGPYEEVITCRDSSTNSENGKETRFFVKNHNEYFCVNKQGEIVFGPYSPNNIEDSEEFYLVDNSNKQVTNKYKCRKDFLDTFKYSYEDTDNLLIKIEGF